MGRPFSCGRLWHHAAIQTLRFVYPCQHEYADPRERERKNEQPRTRDSRRFAHCFKMATTCAELGYVPLLFPFVTDSVSGDDVLSTSTRSIETQFGTTNNLFLADANFVPNIIWIANIRFGTHETNILCSTERIMVKKIQFSKLDQQM